MSLSKGRRQISPGEDSRCGTRGLSKTISPSACPFAIACEVFFGREHRHGNTNKVPSTVKTLFYLSWGKPFELSHDCTGLGAAANATGRENFEKARLLSPAKSDK